MERDLTTRRVTVWGFALVVAFASLSAHAAEDPTRKAVELTKLGIALQEKGEHALALKAFEEAVALADHPKIRFYQGRSLIALDRCEEAMVLFQPLVDDSRLEPARRADVTIALEKCRFDLQTTPVTFDVSGLAGATITVNGKALGATPLTVPLKRGAYTARAELPGYTAIEEARFTVAGEDAKTVSLRLVRVVVDEPAPVAAPSSERSADAGVTRNGGKVPWGWIALGGGIAATAAGAGLVGYYGYLHGKSLRANQQIEGSEVDLGLGIGLLVTGIASGVASIWLFD